MTANETVFVVVPTIRLRLLEETFLPAWAKQFEKHNVELVIIDDSKKKPTLRHNGKVHKLPEKLEGLIINKNDGVRNWGLYYAYTEGADIVISLDDDVLPEGDTIGDHIKALSFTAPANWINTAQDVAVRGLPYGVRKDLPVMVSHGVWSNVPDLDAPTQLLHPELKDLIFHKINVPRGVQVPFCAMNFALRRDAIPYAYQAPMVDGFNRFADIWGGIELKNTCDKKNWGFVTGYARVFHKRASNVFKNLQFEAKGIEANENYGEYPIHKKFRKMRNKFIKLCHESK